MCRTPPCRLPTTADVVRVINRTRNTISDLILEYEYHGTKISGVVSQRDLFTLRNMGHFGFRKSPSHRLCPYRD